MEVGLFFGSFNPIHIGHLIIARAALNYSSLQQVWFVVSPQSPFKQLSMLANERDRLAMVDLAVAGDSQLRSSAVEFDLPKPSYTVDTLSHLGSLYPELKFSLILGSDNLVTFDRWKNHENILAKHLIYTYLRSGREDFTLKNHPSIVVLEDAPFLDISSTYIRRVLREGKSARFLTVPAVINYITNEGLYRLQLD